MMFRPSRLSMLGQKTALGSLALMLLVTSCASDQDTKPDAGSNSADQGLSDTRPTADLPQKDQGTPAPDLRAPTRPADGGPPRPDQSLLPTRPLLCGARVCDPWAEDCCSGEDGETCVPRGSCNSDKINCLTAANCPTNQRCCFFVDNHPIDVACVYTCPALTLCETSADCASGVACVEMTESINVCEY